MYLIYDDGHQNARECFIVSAGTTNMQQDAKFYKLCKVWISMQFCAQVGKSKQKNAIGYKSIQSLQTYSTVWKVCKSLKKSEEVCKNMQ